VGPCYKPYRLTARQRPVRFGATGEPRTAENAEIIEVLRGLGVDYAQGYGVSQSQRALKGTFPFSRSRCASLTMSLV
jgi:hypothetical protein